MKRVLPSAVAEMGTSTGDGLDLSLAAMEQEKEQQRVAPKWHPGAVGSRPREDAQPDPAQNKQSLRSAPQT
eukprot:CAMPEP_0196789340 /NCGR_PEP_ID=MMETSP1104-20130614/26444_1 /TAXON_ID=33652 /ORGANISM="Cafeteria sp., Strain Caron Lab Isolate" /LENGTH=70 /DNA_ID=CAMNT_0042159695 /DNA_START=53 /DNA_END=267 /DNA_ORIENTATION=-